MDSVNLFNWKKTDQSEEKVLKPWKPRPLAHDQWPPDYRRVFAWRLKTRQQLRSDPNFAASAKKYYSTRPGEFIMDWMDTYNPRKNSMKWMPFVFFLKQAELIEFFHTLRNEQESGLIEKCRDAGATWLACGYTVWAFLFIKDGSIGWGSRKAMLVDELGNPDSIFEKMRLIIRRLPACFLPKGWNEKKHATYMKFQNPENGSSIKGEAGDNIGRGGRSDMYFKDESAHYERPDKIEAALSENTNVQIDISSVNGLGNVFHRRRSKGVEWRPGAVIQPGFTRVMVVDWRDHPEKTQEWYDTKQAKYQREGLMHLFAQEVDRNYSAAVSNTIIPKHYITAAIDAHIKLGWTPEQIGNNHMAGLDVADDGIDRNGLVLRQGLVCRMAEEWGERDPGVATRRTLVALRHLKNCKVQYDSIGIGAAVKSEYNRLVDEKIPRMKDFQFVPWNAGGSVVNPKFKVIENDENSVLNEDMFKNIKAQAWWSVRGRFYKTWRAITEGVYYPVDELISLDSAMPLLYQLCEELAQPVKSEASSTLKMVVDKKPDGMKSPNLGDAFVMCYFPAPEQAAAEVGYYRSN
ncbi:hypothetical protein HUU40_00190 [candidate division KSB1 bacterium]|nr:hypothetical protein [candidate division KSB1 bacterium]